ncbi:hypothetical protein AB4Z38_12065 [Arthrobacter sp. 2RAF6]
MMPDTEGITGPTCVAPQLLDAALCCLVTFDFAFVEPTAILDT